MEGKFFMTDKEKILEEIEKKYNLKRFLAPQEQNYEGYEMALGEIKSGRKKSHWIWYIFPQLKILGKSYNAKYYGIENAEEAKGYLIHPVLGARLIEITQALLDLEEKDPLKVMRSGIDKQKLQSSMTLFAYLSEENSIFHKVLKKFFDGEQDNSTLSFLK